MTLLAERQKLILERARELIDLANTTFGITLPEIHFDFESIKGNLKAGRACRRGPKSIMQINSVLLIQNDEAWKDALLDTLPHELAHIVCQFNPHLGRGHNAGWQRVAATLGATPKARFHSTAPTIYAVGETYIYTDTLGKERVYSQARHKKVQAGWYYTYRATGARVDKQCSYRVLDQTALSTAARSTSNASNAQHTAPLLTSKAVRARAVMRECVAEGVSYDETIQRIMDETGHPKHLAKACYNVGRDQHGIGK